MAQEIDHGIGEEVGRKITIHRLIERVPPRGLGIEQDFVPYGIGERARRVEHTQAGGRVLFNEFAQEGRLPYSALSDDVMRHNGSLLVSGTAFGDKPRASKQASVKEQSDRSVSVPQVTEVMGR